MNSISNNTFSFLSDLEKNNERDWFANNKHRYEEVRSSFIDFLQSVYPSMVEIDGSLAGIDVSKTVFRIYRDVRFSKDKSPYKTNMGALILDGGKKMMSDKAGYYIHIENNSSFIAGGAYMPSPEWLRNIRKEISISSEEFMDIINNESFRKYFGEMEGDKLKKAPKGFSTDHPVIDILRFKSYLAMHKLDNKTVMSDDFGDHFISVISAMKPFNVFLNSCSPLI